eukprot:9498828-Pyramimonas_sp.AAC.2
MLWSSSTAIYSQWRWTGNQSSRVTVLSPPGAGCRLGRAVRPARSQPQQSSTKITRTGWRLRSTRRSLRRRPRRRRFAGWRC